MKASQIAISYSLFLLAWALAYSQSQPSDTTLTSNPVFMTDCAKCHGKNAEDRHFRGPSLVSGKVAAASDEELRNIINNGKSHMPKFSGKITSDEVDTLVHQIKSLNKK